MAEPRARMRNKGQVFSTSDLNDFLYAFGDHTRTPFLNHHSLSSTVSCLDEILTDFVIETCHAAALSASYSRRQKIKVDDFKWVLRKDERLLGRTLEQMWREKMMKDNRRMGGFEDIGGGGAGEGVGDLENIAQVGGVQGSDLKERKRRRRRKRVDGQLVDRKVTKRGAS